MSLFLISLSPFFLFCLKYTTPAMKTRRQIRYFVHYILGVLFRLQEDTEVIVTEGLFKVRDVCLYVEDVMDGLRTNVIVNVSSIELSAKGTIIC